MRTRLGDLLRTKVHLVAISGEVEDHGDHLVLRTPDNPDYHHGNLLVLASPPEELDPWLDRFAAHFGPEVSHRALAWDGDVLDEGLARQAKARSLLGDRSTALVLDAPPDDPPAPALELAIRPLDPARDGPAFVALNLACDPAEAAGPPSYVRFKTGIRASIQRWMERGLATWWGAFEGDELVAQCGMVRCDDLGRFQAVETHPDRRRRGICSALVAHVARSTLADPAIRRVVLEADTLGPAIDLYRRLGFRADRGYQSLVRSGDPLEIRAETPADAAAVRSLHRRAFETDGEARLVDALRDEPGVLGFVAIQSGTLLGHALYSPVVVEGGDAPWGALALGPMAVRADHQGLGVGTRLLERSLAACREAGHEVCFVLGHPAFYARAGFVPAPPRGLTCRWPVPDEVFRVAELVPGALAGRRGRVRYHAAFDALA